MCSAEIRDGTTAVFLVCCRRRTICLSVLREMPCVTKARMADGKRSKHCPMSSNSSQTGTVHMYAPLRVSYSTASRLSCTANHVFSAQFLEWPLARSALLLSQCMTILRQYVLVAMAARSAGACSAASPRYRIARAHPRD
jgi:hypothetical protein